MSERITDKTVVALPIPAFWGLVVLLVVGTSVSTAAFVSIKNDIRALTRDSMTVIQFHQWQDEFRALNKNLEVPPLRSDSTDSKPLALAVIARKEP